MRTHLVVSLALALVALPAAQAAACRCTEAGPAKRATICSCCRPTMKHCCCGSQDEGDARQLRHDCACSPRTPQTPETPVIDTPAPAAAIGTKASEPASPAERVGVRVLLARSEPHPAVLLPLLL